MKILGCFKIVPDLDQVAEEDWVVDANLLIDTGYVKPQWNCFDESALEMMLKLSDLSEGFDVVVELSALTVGKKKHESFLKTLYALGYQKAIRIEEEEKQLSPESVAVSIKSYVEMQEQPDVILMGTQSADGNSGKTPFLLAEHLGWPCISQVIELQLVDKNHLQVRHQIDGAIAVKTVKIPCVLSVGNASSSYLRVPSLKAKMSLGKQPIQLFQPNVYSMEETVEMTALERVERTREAIIIEGETAQKKAEALYDSYLKGEV